MSRLSRLHETVEQYLVEMELSFDGDGPWLFRTGDAVLVISLFEHGEDTFCRVTAVLLEQLEPTLELLQHLLRLNTEVLFGSFLLFEENSLAFSATLLGNHLDLDEFAKTLRYVAHVAQLHTEDLAALAGGLAPLATQA